MWEIMWLYQTELQPIGLLRHLEFHDRTSYLFIFILFEVLQIYVASDNYDRMYFWDQRLDYDFQG